MTILYLQLLLIPILIYPEALKKEKSELKTYCSIARTTSARRDSRVSPGGLIVSALATLSAGNALLQYADSSYIPRNKVAHSVKLLELLG
ncbi:hypothetical protein J6590_039228 [Homalodisca vitripennis]|nr:hypothetical protein J6590_039228 [Homalodisca vitripennis]